MIISYLLFNYALYIFVHIFTGVEMLCLFVYQLFIDLSCVFICNLEKLFIRISIKSRTNVVMVICLSIVIDDLVTWNTWYAISYVFGITQFFFFCIVDTCFFIYLPLYTCLHVTD
jgi:hypothetical protein